MEVRRSADQLVPTVVVRRTGGHRDHPALLEQERSAVTLGGLGAGGPRHLARCAVGVGRRAGHRERDGGVRRIVAGHAHRRPVAVPKGGQIRLVREYGGFTDTGGRVHHGAAGVRVEVGCPTQGAHQRPEDRVAVGAVAVRDLGLGVPIHTVVEDDVAGGRRFVVPPAGAVGHGVDAFGDLVGGIVPVDAIQIVADGGCAQVTFAAILEAHRDAGPGVPTREGRAQRRSPLAGRERLGIAGRVDEGVDEDGVHAWILAHRRLGSREVGSARMS